MNTSVPRRRWALALALVAVAIAATAAPCLAQERFGALTGTVKDDTGAVLPGVTVSITNKQTGKVYTVVTGSDGGYRLLDLEPGRYSVRFELTGFSTAEQPDVNLLLGKTLELSPVMAVGGVNEAITVSGESPLIDARSTTIAHNVTAEEIRPHAEGPQLPEPRDHVSLGQRRRGRRRHPGERRERRRRTRSRSTAS